MNIRLNIQPIGETINVEPEHVVLHMNIRLNIQPIGETINVEPEHVVLHETFSPFLGHVAELLRDVEDDGTFTTSVRVIRKSPGGGAYEITYTEA